MILKFSVFASLVLGVNSQCVVCGEGKSVTKPDVVWQLPGQPAVQCGLLETVGAQGLVPDSFCALLPPLIAEPCGCEGEAAETNAPVSDAPVVPETAAPIVPETAAPVVPETAAPVVPETAAPVVPETAAPVVPETAAPKGYGGKQGGGKKGGYSDGNENEHDGGHGGKKGGHLGGNTIDEERGENEYDEKKVYDDAEDYYSNVDSLLEELENEEAMLERNVRAFFTSYESQSKCTNRHDDGTYSQGYNAGLMTFEECRDLCSNKMIPITGGHFANQYELCVAFSLSDHEIRFNDDGNYYCGWERSIYRRKFCNLFWHCDKVRRDSTRDSKCRASLFRLTGPGHLKCEGIWSDWYNRDHPSGTGDYEPMSLADPVPCAGDEPAGIECQTTNGIDAAATGETVTCDTNYGFKCVNEEQTDGNCDYDYKVRYRCNRFWTNWHNRDMPSGTGDYEPLSLANPVPCAGAMIAGIECQTTNGLDAASTGEIVTCNANYGFKCVNEDQRDGKCDFNYKVRYLCECNN